MVAYNNAILKLNVIVTGSSYYFRYNNKVSLSGKTSIKKAKFIYNSMKFHGLFIKSCNFLNTVKGSLLFIITLEFLLGVRSSHRRCSVKAATGGVLFY